MNPEISGTWLEAHSYYNCKFNGFDGVPVCISIDNETKIANLTFDIDPRFCIDQTKYTKRGLNFFFKIYARHRYGIHLIKPYMKITGKISYLKVDAYKIFNPRVFQMNLKNIESYPSSLRICQFYKNIFVEKWEVVLFTICIIFGVFFCVIGAIIFIRKIKKEIYDTLFWLSFVFMPFGSCLFIIVEILDYPKRELYRHYYNYLSYSFQGLNSLKFKPADNMSDIKYKAREQFYLDIYRKHLERKYKFITPKDTYYRAVLSYGITSPTIKLSDMDSNSFLFYICEKRKREESKKYVKNSYFNNENERINKKNKLK